MSNGMLSEIPPDSPDPGHETVKFLAWLKKRGTVKSLVHCRRKWKNLDIENIAQELGPYLMAIYVSSRVGKVVVLEDAVWADRWMIYYDEEVPHHGQMTGSRTRASITGSKV